jgi:hypothetical protein
MMLLAGAPVVLTLMPKYAFFGGEDANPTHGAHGPQSKKTPSIVRHVPTKQ